MFGVRTHRWAISHRLRLQRISPQQAISCATLTSSADRLLLNPRLMAHHRPRLSSPLDDKPVAGQAVRPREGRTLNRRGGKMQWQVTLIVYIISCNLGLAQTSEEWTNCLAGDLRTPDLPIQGCTAVIKTGRDVIQRLATAYNNRGVALRLKTDYASAIADFNEAIRLAPNYANAFNNRGVAFRNAGDLEHAIADYDQAILIKPDYVAAFYNRGLALADKYQYERAISDFTTVLRFDPANPTVLFRRSGLYSKIGDIVASQNDLTEAIKIKPDIAKDVD